MLAACVTFLLPEAMDGARTEHEIVDSFVSVLRSLMNDLAKRRPDDATVGRVKKRLSIAAEAVPVTIIEIAGPVLYQYRDEIFSGNRSTWKRFFTDPDVFNNDIAQSTDEGRRDIATDMIPKIQEIVGSMPSCQHDKYIEIVRDLLDDYLELLVVRN
jgi:hypothetical protein